MKELKKQEIKVLLPSLFPEHAKSIEYFKFIKEVSAKVNVD